MAVFALSCARAEAIPFCSFSTSAIAFGTYNPLAASPTTSSGAITINCFFTTTVMLALSAGQGNSFTPRAMAGPSALKYNLYVDPAYARIWGDGTGTTSTVTMSFGFFTPAVPVYGAIPTLQDVAAGSYSDTITVTASY